MTRFLSNKLTGEIDEQDLEVAKEILRTKFVVGILKEFNKTMEHFEKYFEWQIINRPHRMKCVENMISGGSNRHRFTRDHVIKGSRAYSLLHWQNQFGKLTLAEYSSGRISIIALLVSSNKMLSTSATVAANTLYS